MASRRGRDAGPRACSLNDAVEPGGLRLHKLQPGNLGEGPQDSAGVDVRQDDAIDPSQRPAVGIRLQVPDHSPQSFGQG